MGFASQSGGLGISALEFCAERGLGLSAFASLGNKADLSSNDLIAWWDRDEQTRVILLYLEGFGNPGRFARLARLISRRTPIVALKSGRGAAGRRAAGSHTASLAAGDISTNALFRAAGVVRVDTVEELFEAGQLIAQQPLPAGRRIGVLSNAGGAAILAADACESRHLEVPQFSSTLQERLAAAGPGVAGTSNPVDLGAGANPEVFTAAGNLILDSGEIDALVVVFTPPQGADPAGIAQAAQDLADGRVTVVGCMSGTGRPTAPEDAEWPVPWHSFPESAVRALSHAVRAGEFQRRPLDPAVPAPTGIDAPAARRALESAPPGAWLEPRAVEEMLMAYGIRVARSREVASAEEAAAVQAEFGGPVVVKLMSRTITHKSDIGGVVLDCRTPEAAAEAYRTIATRLEAMGQAQAMDGALVQEQADEGLDLIVGAVADPVFGPLVLAGVGGVEAEVWKDQTLALAPVGPRTAEAVWRDLRGGVLIDGWRGAPGADRARLADVVRRVAELIADQSLLAELDLNPVRGLGVGGEVIVLDARARRAAIG
jgi:acyl-CoA synthetase (NDP forming)